MGNASPMKLERIGIAGLLRGFVAGMLGCILWVAVVMAYVTAAGGAEGEGSSVMETVLLMLVSAAVTVVPFIASQMTRGCWSLDEMGLHERITPLVSFLPFGVNRERLVRWQDVEKFGVDEVRLRGDRVLHYFRVHITGRPRIEVVRKETKDDPGFDEFVAEFARRMAK